MSTRFASSCYIVKTAGGQEVVVDVTNSISAGLVANSKLISHILSFKNDTGCSRVLDFGAGALRHSLPLLKKGLQVTAVEYKKAYDRPKAAELRAKAEKHPGFTKLMWPDDFIRSTDRYDVVILSFVLQVIPSKVDREDALKAISKHFDPNGPKRLYYASRFGDAKDLSDDMRYKDGWVKGVGEKDRSFYTEWNASTTDAYFKKYGYERAGTYSSTSQGYIYEYKPGVI